MVKGFESFRKWFEGYEDNYTIIGGTACDLILTEMNQDFRATKDIDLPYSSDFFTPRTKRTNL